MDLNEVDRIVERPALRWYEDGLAEILTGSATVAVGVLEGLWGLGAYAMLVASLLALLLGSRTVIALKRRFVFPRAGEIEYSPLPTRDGQPMPLRLYLLWLAAPALLAWPTAYAIARLRSHHGLWLEELGTIGNLVFWTGPLWAVVIALVARQTRQRRLLALAALSMLLGPVAGVATRDGHLALGGYLLGMGAGALVSGALAFGRFARRYPQVRAESDAR